MNKSSVFPNLLVQDLINPVTKSRNMEIMPQVFEHIDMDRITAI